MLVPLLSRCGSPWRCTSSLSLSRRTSWSPGTSWAPWTSWRGDEPCWTSWSSFGSKGQQVTEGWRVEAKLLCNLARGRLSLFQYLGLSILSKAKSRVLWFIINSLLPKTKYPNKASWPGFLASGTIASTELVLMKAYSMILQNIFKKVQLENQCLHSLTMTNCGMKLDFAAIIIRNIFKHIDVMFLWHVALIM